METMILLSVLLVILSIVYIFYYHYYHPYKICSKAFDFVSGPKPEFLFGNLRQIMMAECAPKAYEAWERKYGPTFLMYLGISPVLITQDTKVIKDVLVKNFSNFSDRTHANFNMLKFLLKQNESLPTLSGEKWKQLRKLISPNFTGKKLRALGSVMETSCNNLKEAMIKSAANSASIDVTKHFNAFSIEFILCTVLGRECNLQIGSNDLADIIVKTLQKTFGNLYGQEKVLAFLSHFPILAPLVGKYVGNSSLAKQWDPLQNVATELVRQRKDAKHSQLRKDFLQFLIDAEDTDDNHTYSCKLTEKEIISTVLVIILSGVLHHFTYTSYLLALHPYVQDRLINEIKEYFDGNPEATLLEAAEDIEYAEMTLLEVFRLYPGINMLSRVCAKTCVIGNGLKIPRDTIVYIPIHNLHYNPKYWVEPEKFKPDRFSHNADVPYDPFAFLPFGEGPRMCPGKRLAYVKLKMAIINILKDYRFVRAADTEVPLEVENYFQVCPVRHVKLAIEKI